jgi:hypothetical protein
MFHIGCRKECLETTSKKNLISDLIRKSGDEFVNHIFTLARYCQIVDQLSLIESSRYLTWGNEMSFVIIYSTFNTHN